MPVVGLKSNYSWYRWKCQTWQNAMLYSLKREVTFIYVTSQGLWTFRGAYQQGWLAVGHSLGHALRELERPATEATASCQWPNQCLLEEYLVWLTLSSEKSDWQFPSAFSDQGPCSEQLGDIATDITAQQQLQGVNSCCKLFFYPHPIKLKQHLYI